MEKYFLIATLSTIVFYTIYYFFLQKESFHQFNRFYLLGALLLSLIIPLLKFAISLPELQTATSVEAAGQELSIQTLRENIAEFITYIQLPEITVSAQTSSGLNISKLFIGIYMIGVFVFSIFFIIKLFKISALILQSSKNRNGKFVYIKYEEHIAPFSFFNFIFMNTDAYSEEDKEQIMLHEQIHVRQLHSLDLIISELVAIILWFNPIMMLYKRSLQVTHEYLADNRVLQHGFEQGAYLNLLLRQLTLQNEWMLGHHFNYLLTKNRFKMLKKNHYSKWALAKFALVLPLVALLLMLNCKKNSQGTVVSEDAPIESVVMILMNGIPVVSEIYPESALRKALTDTATITIKEGQITYMKPIEDGEIWNCLVFLDELKSQYFYLAEGEYQFVAQANKPDFLEIKSSTNRTTVYEAQRDATGIIYVIDIKTGAKDPEYLKISKDEDTNKPPHRFVEKMPEPIGGFDEMYKFLQENLKYPAEAKEKKIGGQVFIEFVIEKDGSVSNVKVLEGVDPTLDAEAVRVMKLLPKWKPAKQMGKPVRCFYQIPIRFTIN